MVCLCSYDSTYGQSVDLHSNCVPILNFLHIKHFLPFTRIVHSALHGLSKGISILLDGSNEVGPGHRSGRMRVCGAD